MRKHFLILMLMALLPLASWADVGLTATMNGEGITAQQAGSYEAYYKGSVYSPAFTVTWDNGTAASPVTEYSVSYQKDTDGQYTQDNLTPASASDLKNAGYYLLTVSYTPAGYSTQTVALKFQIKKIPVTLTADDKSKTYGESDPTFTATPNWTANVGPITGETLQYSVTRPNAATDVNAGVYNDAIAVTLTVNSTVNANYNITPVAGKFTIDPKEVIISAKNKSITYGAAVPTLTANDYTVTGLVGDDAGADLTDVTSIPGLTAGMEININYQNSGQNSDMDAVSGKIKVKDGGYPIVITAPTIANTCNYTFTAENAVLTVKKATLTISVKNKEITFGDNNPDAADYEYTYDGGLMTQAEINEYVDANNVIANTNTHNIFDAALIALVYEPATPANVGNYTVTISGMESPNYKVMINAGTLHIAEKSVGVPGDVTVATQYNAGTAQSPQMVDYQYLGGTAIEPTVTVGNLEENSDFTVTYYNNTEAYTLTGDESFTKQVTVNSQQQTVDKTAEEINFPYVVIEGIGNYTGTIKKAFGIAKAPLTITAEDKTKTLGGDVTFTAAFVGLLESNAGEIETQLQNKQEGNGFTGAINIYCLGGNNAGTFDIIMDVANLVSKNYTLTPVNGTLTVNPATLPLKIVTSPGTYGDNVTIATNFDYEFNNESADAEGISTTVKNNFKVLVPVDDITWTVKKGDETIEPNANGEWVLAVGNDYTVYASTINDDYTVDFEPAALTVNPANLTIEIVNQTAALFNAQGEKKEIYTDGSVNLDAVFYDDTDNVPAHTAYDPTNNPNGYTIKVSGLKNSDTIDDLNFADELASTVATVGVHVNAITYQIASGKTANPNYNYVVDVTNNGQLTFTGPTLEIARGVDNSAQIANYAGATGVSVKVTRDIPAAAIEHWFTMVLPFNATLSELCEQWGYVVVNTLDKTNDKESKVVFKLQMQGITANEPFLIKFSQPVANAVTFTNRTIADVDYTQTPVVEDNAGTNHNKFIGSYDNLTVEASDYNWIIDTMKDKFVRNTSASNVQSIYAYLHTAEVLSSFAPSIYIQDENGNVTAINSIATDAPAMSGEGWYTINGVKLQGAPTEKGVYIQNGKKVILK